MVSNVHQIYSSLPPNIHQLDPYGAHVPPTFSLFGKSTEIGEPNMNIKSFSAVTANTDVVRPTFAYRADLVNYLADRKAICDTFFINVAVAEKKCDIATYCANTRKDHDVAQAAYMARIRIVAWIQSEAINALGLPPAMPIDN